MERAVSRRRQRGAALFIVVMLFLILLPLGMMAIFQRSLQNDQFAQSALWRVQARDAANQTMAQLRSDVANSIGTAGLLEYQASPPAWFVTQAQASQVNPVSVGFWQQCATQGLCQQSQVQLRNGTGRQTFTVRELVLPTGVIDPTLCNAQGYVAVFYTLWVQALASSNPAAEAATTQSVYRACVLQG
jgi:Tfp pilus assembly protein PilX